MFPSSSFIQTSTKCLGTDSQGCEQQRRQVLVPPHYPLAQLSLFTQEQKMVNITCSPVSLMEMFKNWNEFAKHIRTCQQYNPKQTTAFSPHSRTKLTLLLVLVAHSSHYFAWRDEFKKKKSVFRGTQQQINSIHKGTIFISEAWTMVKISTRKKKKTCLCPFHMRKIISFSEMSCGSGTQC